MSAAGNATANSLKPSVNKKGEYVQKQSEFRNFVTADGSSGFKAEANRYHLYVSYACPWAHRTLITRVLKGLEDVISYDVVDWMKGEEGWNFTEDPARGGLDTVNGCAYVKEIYLKANPDYTGRISVPVLWDKQKGTIVNNESSEILRMFSKEFNEFCKTPEQQAIDLRPAALIPAIDAVNEWVYPQINIGVYRSGFATSQEAYNTAVREVFAGLDKAAKILSTHRYLTGSQLTEADIRLFTTLVRFDIAYNTHFKCNKNRLIDYPSLWGFTRDIYQLPGVAGTVNMDHIKNHYYASQKNVNPTGIVAIGPDLDFFAPHNRAGISA